jgi:hypothetical protein
LAKAHAWNGDRDRALHHSRLAVKHAGGDREAVELEASLSEDREPRVGASVRTLFQPGTVFGLTGLRTAAFVRGDVTPFVTAYAELGFEQYWAGTGLEQGGSALVVAGTQLRPSAGDVFDLELGFRAVRLAGQGLEALLQHTHRFEGLTLRSKLERRARSDSYQALVGTALAGGAVVGAVSQHLLSVGVEVPLGFPVLAVAPGIGVLTQEGGPASFNTGLSASLELPFVKGEDFALSVAYQSQLWLYGQDHSGFGNTAVEPFGGGYYSPRFYWGQAPMLSLRWKLAPRASLALTGGPALQLEVPRTGGATFLPGGSAAVTARFDVARNLELALGAGFIQTSNLFSRFDADVSLAYRF